MKIRIVESMDIEINPFEVGRINAILCAHSIARTTDAYGRVWAHDVWTSNGQTEEAYTLIETAAFALRWCGY
jgi:hypothetical protein